MGSIKKALIIVALVAQIWAKAPKVLTDENFEHETQSITGSTTGDWLILFYDTRFKLCSEIQPMWEELTGVLFGKINVAHVNV